MANRLLHTLWMIAVAVIAGVVGFLSGKRGEISGDTIGFILLILIICFVAAEFVPIRPSTYERSDFSIRSARDDYDALLMHGVAVVFLAFLAVSYLEGAISAERAALLSLTGGLVVTLLLRLLCELNDGQSVGVDSHWGGLGGGLGGWRLTTPSVLLVALLTVVSVVAILVFELAPGGTSTAGNGAAGATKEMTDGG